MKANIFCLAIPILMFTACDDLDMLAVDRPDALMAPGDDQAAVGALMEGEYTEDPALVPSKGPFDFANPEPEPMAVSCTGWPSGDWCMARCGNGSWYPVGHWTSIPYGNCIAAGQKFCGYYGMAHTGACWGHP